MGSGRPQVRQRRPVLAELRYLPVRGRIVVRGAGLGAGRQIVAPVGDGQLGAVGLPLVALAELAALLRRTTTMRAT